MSRLVERARELGIEWGEAEILRGNAPALQLARNFGGRIESDYRSAFVVKVRAPISRERDAPECRPDIAPNGVLTKAASASQPMGSIQ